MWAETFELTQKRHLNGTNTTETLDLNVKNAALQTGKEACDEIILFEQILFIFFQRSVIHYSVDFSSTCSKRRLVDS